MANKTNRISPKIEIINHFDRLINRVDIDIEQSIEKYNQEQVLIQLDCFDIGKRYVKNLNNFYLNYFDPSGPFNIEYQTVDEWPESTKVVDYLNRVRKRTIDELTKAREDTLEYWKLNSSQFKSNDHQKKIEEIRSEIFKEKFYFQVHCKPNKWIFNLFTFVTDFYMSQKDINLLEKFINAKKLNENEDNVEMHRVLFDPDYDFVLDENMVIIGLLQKKFFANLKTQKFPSHVIIVRKEDILHIEEISYYNFFSSRVNLTPTTIDLSKTERLNLYLNGVSALIKIEGLSSIKSLSLKFDSLEQLIVSDLFELRDLSLILYERVDSEVLFKFNDFLPNIELLKLDGNLSYFNLDRLSNLKSLSLDGTIMDDFNFGLFDNSCNQLEYIYISSRNIEDEFFGKLFYGRSFTCVFSLWLSHTRISKLEKELFNGFPKLQELMIFDNKELRIIKNDTFSNLKQLLTLGLSNNGLENIEENSFLSLHNLETLDLSNNQLTSLNPKSFLGLNNLIYINLKDNKLIHFDLDILDNIRQIEEIDLSGNPIVNKEEILKRSVSSLIKIIL